MATEFIMPDGTHIRVNDEDAEALKEAEGWTFVGVIEEDPTPLTVKMFSDEA